MWATHVSNYSVERCWWWMLTIIIFRNADDKCYTIMESWNDGDWLPFGTRSSYPLVLDSCTLGTRMPREWSGEWSGSHGREPPCLRIRHPLALESPFGTRFMHPGDQNAKGVPREWSGSHGREPPCLRIRHPLPECQGSAKGVIRESWEGTPLP